MKTETFKRSSRWVVFVSTCIVAFYAIIVLSVDFWYALNDLKMQDIGMTIGLALATIVLAITWLAMPSDFHYEVTVDGNDLSIKQSKDCIITFDIPSLDIKKQGRKVLLSAGKQKNTFCYNDKFFNFLVSIAKNKDTVETEEEHVS